MNLEIEYHNRKFIKQQELRSVDFKRRNRVEQSPKRESSKKVIAAMLAAVVKILPGQ